MTVRKCKEQGCRLIPKRSGLCAYHSTKAENGEKWAKLCHPNSPANPDYKEPQGAENFRR